VILDDLSLEAPRTKDIVALMAALDVNRSALLLLPEADGIVELSARNLPNVKTLRASYISVRDLLGYETIIMPQQAIGVLSAFLGDDVPEAVEEE